jgi:hypothetical protein
VLGVPGIIIALVIRFTLREPARGAQDPVEHQQGRVALRATIAVLWRIKAYRLLVTFAVVNGFTQFGLNQWWPSFYLRTFGVSLATVGTSLGIASGVGLGIGMLLGGLLGNTAAQRDVKLPLVIGAIATCLMLPVGVGSLFTSSPSLSFVLVGIMGLLANIAAAPTMATIYSLVSPHMRATAGAICIFFISAVGFGLGPFCVGLVSDALTPALGSQALRYALLVPLGVMPLGILALWRGAHALQR